MSSHPQEQVELVPIEAAGYSPAFFHLDDEHRGSAGFQYYVFVKLPYSAQQPHWPTNWDILGVRPAGGEQVDLQLRHIEEEDLEQPSFCADRDAPGFISLDPARTWALIRFLDEDVGACQHLALTSPKDAWSGVEDLRQLGFRAAPWDLSGTAASYCVPTKAAAGQPSLIRLIVLVHGSAAQSRGEPTGLHFISFDLEPEQRVDMNPWDVDGLGLMPMSRREVCALAQLLRERQ